MSEAAGRFTEEWLTLREAGAVSPYSSGSLQQFIYRGTLRARRRGHQWFIHRDDLAEYIERMRAAGSQKHTPKDKRKTGD